MITLTPDSAAAPTRRIQGKAAVAEQYYSLIHWLRTVGDVSGIGPKLVGLTSCTRGAGVSSVASNLAIAAAQLGDQPVLLLDLSATRPGGAARFGIAGDLGLRAALADVEHASEYAKQTPIENLSLLAPNASEEPSTLILDWVKLNSLVQSLDRDFGFIVVDLPTVGSSLCFVAAGLLNGVLLVMEAERTRSDIAARAKQRLLDARANVMGVILNKHSEPLPNWLEARL